MPFGLYYVASRAVAMAISPPHADLSPRVLEDLERLKAHHMSVEVEAWGRVRWRYCPVVGRTARDEAIGGRFFGFQPQSLFLVNTQDTRFSAGCVLINTGDNINGKSGAVR
jgi:hypothetical protein